MTLLNLLSGVLAIICVFQYGLYQASWFIILGAILDFGDGLVARLLRVHSDLGRQLDSLADVVTFGVAPGLIGFQLLHSAHGQEWYTFLPLMIPLFGALRLARFNIDLRQHDSFIGLPIPATALFWLSLPMIAHYQDNTPAALFDPAIMQNPVLIVSASIIFSVLMVSNLKMMTLKFKKFGWADNQFRYIFILLSGILLMFFFFAAIPIILLLYILISIIQNLGKK